MHLPNLRGYLFLALVAAASRIALLAVGILSDAVLPDYDSSAELHSSSCSELDSPIDESPFKKAVRSSIVWDSVYFEHLARCGYNVEHFFAFFPGLPTLMRLVSFGKAHPWTQVAGLLISVFSFTSSAVLLYRYMRCLDPISCRCNSLSHSPSQGSARRSAQPCGLAWRNQRVVSHGRNNILMGLHCPVPGRLSRISQFCPSLASGAREISRQPKKSVDDASAQT
jgi:hypothetical protein